MNIIIDINELLYDIKSQSATMAIGLENVEQKYEATISDHNIEQVKRFLVEAISSLSGVFLPFLQYDMQLEGINNSEHLPDSIVLELEIGERRMIGKTQILTDKSHEFLTNLVLAKFYSIMQGEWSKMYYQKTEITEREITAVIYSKSAPILY